MQSAKEKASNAAASARAGMEKTKAAVQEKVDKMKTRDPQEKAMAEQRKEERQHEAELDKQITKEDNAEGMAARRMGEHHHSTAGLGSGNTVTRTPVASERVIGGPGHRID